MIDAPALTNWELGEVVRSAIENAELLVFDRKAGLGDGPRADARRGGVGPPGLRGGASGPVSRPALGPLVDVGTWEHVQSLRARYSRRHRGSVRFGRGERAWPRGTYLIGREAEAHFRAGSSGTRTAKQRDPRAKGWLVPSPEASQPLAAVVPGAPRSPGKEGLDRADPPVRWSVEPACPGTAA